MRQRTCSVNKQRITPADNAIVQAAALHRVPRGLLKIPGSAIDLNVQCHGLSAGNVSAKRINVR